MTEPPPPPNAAPSTTEDVPSAPGWVEQGVDEIFADLQIAQRQRPGVRRLRTAYLDCLAGAGRGRDIDETHDRCRRTLLAALSGQEAVAAEIIARLEPRLEALEAEISQRI